MNERPHNTLYVKGDKVIWLIYMLLALISVVAVFSSSTYRSNQSGEDKMMLLVEQLYFVAAGFVIVIIASVIPLKVYRKIAFPAFVVSVFLLVLSLIPATGGVVNKASRGVKLFGITFQVFEVMKIGLILYLARAVELWEDTLVTFKDYAVKFLLPVAAVCLMVIPNGFSSTVLLAIASLLLLFFMQIDFKYLLLTVVGALALFFLLFGVYKAFYAGKESTKNEDKSVVEKFFNRFSTVESRVANFKAELHNRERDLSQLSEKDRQKIKDDNHQSEQAKIAIAQGGILGKGPGKSTMRFSLPEAFSDFIFAFIVEEYGLAGGSLVVMLYLILLFRCIRLSTKCLTSFSCAVVIGFAFLIAIQASIHILVNVRLIPITGQTLPVISHGGTAYLMMSLAFGIILSISRQIDRQERLRQLAAEINRNGLSDENITDEEPKEVTNE